MIRVLIFFAVVALAAFGATWLADHPGTVLVTWGGHDYQFSTLLGLVAVLALAVVAMILWSLLRLVFSLPSIISVAGRAKRRNRGLKALSQGMMAVGSGDSGAASRYAREAGRLLGTEPMTLLLQAQSAQLNGDRDEATRLFTAMLEHDDTRMLGLRGLYMEAQRRGDGEAAFRFASEAQKRATLPWAGQAVLQHRAAARDWAGALATVERNAGGRLIDRPTANRQRAVLQTAIALDCAGTSPDEALGLAREALRVAPTLVPAAALAGQLLARKGDLRKAAKTIETAYAATPHPDLATVYVNARLGDAAADRLARAETLARQAPGHPESRLAVARAALEAREFGKARAVLSPLHNGEAGSRPSLRTCLMMADIEEAEHGETGALFEWLQRAARAPHDPAWIADGVISDTWAPVSPVTGRIDAFVWETPNEQLQMPEHRPIPRRERQDSNEKPLLPALAAAPDEAELLPLSVEQTDRPDKAPEPAPVAATATPAPRAPAGAVVFPLVAAPDDPGPSHNPRASDGFAGDFAEPPRRNLI